MTLPVPVFDHVVVNVRDRMDEGAACWRRLGFTLTPRGHHTLGSINHLAVFGSDYLELIGLPQGGARLDLMDWSLGLNGLVFGTEDPDGLHAALLAAGLPCDPPQAFSRPVALPGGATRDAAFRTVRLRREATEAGRLYFCHHATRELVWRDEWRRHANAAIGVAGAIIAAEDPAALASLFARMFGADAVSGHRVAVGLATITIVTPRQLQDMLGTVAPEGAGRAAWMAALQLRTASLDATATALREIPDLRIAPDAITVPAAAAMNVALSFLP